MSDVQAVDGVGVEAEKREFLPLGSVVVLKGSVKKLLIASRGSLVEGQFFEYGAFLFPEGMIDTNIAYFNGDDVMKVVFEGYRDDDDALVVEMLNDAYEQFRAGEAAAADVAGIGANAHVNTNANVAVGVGAGVASQVPVSTDDLFASVRDLGDDDE